MKEGDYNARLLIAIKRLGIHAFKVADKFTSGVPDIYMSSGNWIEGKVVTIPKHAVSVIKHLEPTQRNFMNNAMHCGDRCFVAVYWVNENGLKWFTLVPWLYLRAIRFWRMEDIVHFGWEMTWKGALNSVMDYQTFRLDRFFDKKAGAPFYVPNDWWIPTWKEWAAEHPHNWAMPDTSLDCGIKLEDELAEKSP